MTGTEARHRTLQIANNAALLLASRFATAIGVPVMLFFAVQVWDDVDEIKDAQHRTDISIVKMQGSMELLKFRLDANLMGMANGIRP